MSHGLGKVKIIWDFKHNSFIRLNKWAYHQTSYTSIQEGMIDWESRIFFNGKRRDEFVIK